MPFRNLLSRLSENEYTTKDSICKIDMFYNCYRYLVILYNYLMIQGAPIFPQTSVEGGPTHTKSPKVSIEYQFNFDTIG